MSELLKKAEAYYAIATDLQRQGEGQLEMARYLNGVADRMCEENMRQKKATDVVPDKPYYCNLCGANGDAESLRGVYFETQATKEKLVERPWQQVEHHICNKCLDDLRQFSACREK